MKGKSPLPLSDIFKHLGESRVVALSAGRSRHITARKVIWEMLDYLVNEWGYPVAELVDETLLLFGESSFDAEFEEGVLVALTAQLHIASGAANINVFKRKEGSVLPPLDHPVWHAHQPAVQTITLPQVTLRGAPLAWTIPIS